MTRRRTIAVPRAQARLHLAKARQFLEEAEAAALARRHDAAMLNAVHAGIAAADAVSVALAGRRSAGQDHAAAIDLLEEAGRDYDEARIRAQQLSALISKKNLSAYESRRVRAGEAVDAVKRATRLVTWAEDLVPKVGR